MKVNMIWQCSQPRPRTRRTAAANSKDDESSVYKAESRTLVMYQSRGNDAWALLVVPIRRTYYIRVPSRRHITWHTDLACHTCPVETAKFTNDKLIDRHV